MSIKIYLEVEIPDPPVGHRHESRVPFNREQYYQLVNGAWVFKYRSYTDTDSSYVGAILCYKIINEYTRQANAATSTPCRICGDPDCKKD